MVDDPGWAGAVSSLVIVKPDGSLPEPLCFLLLVDGPIEAFGEAGRERLRGVKVAEVAEEIANGLLDVAMGKFGLKLFCRPFRSFVEKDCLNILGVAEDLFSWPVV